VNHDLRKSEVRQPVIFAAFAAETGKPGNAKQTFALYAELHDMQQFRKIISCQRLWMEAN